MATEPNVSPSNSILNNLSIEKSISSGKNTNSQKCDFDSLPDFKSTGFPVDYSTTKPNTNFCQIDNPKFNNLNNNYFFSPIYEEPFATSYTDYKSSATVFSNLQNFGSTVLNKSADINPQIPEDICIKNNIPKTYRSEFGTLYKSVTEEKIEINEKGEQIKRVYVKYEPCEEFEKPSEENGGLKNFTGENSTEAPTIIQSFSYTPQPLVYNDFESSNRELNNQFNGFDSEENDKNRQTLAQFMSNFKNSELQKQLEENLAHF
ncbi:unnamed protein product [Rotaria magnacalcarata]|uniref:Uncharacterized protein n=1 Tax=Rotaria magnacalcarata TaxID=392030 RepID=A0A819S4U9_9BILA|nr:unnamed protein product [Rotaria magnacalcarata]CAF4053711.1 unnamed protein product [Rotaria magnacalcarata]